LPFGSSVTTFCSCLFYGTNGIDWGWQKEQIARQK